MKTLELPLCPQCKDEFLAGAMELDMCMGCLINELHRKDDRVKRLEVALKMYATTNETFPEYGDVARKLLEEV